MKRILPYTNLSEREVPAALDRAVLSYAAQRCRRKRFLRRSWLCIGGVAAALCIAAFTGVLWQMKAQKATEHMELLAMGDFSRLDQSGFNITLELNSSGDFGAY